MNATNKRTHPAVHNDEACGPTRAFQHICWDGCMFPNETMLAARTWIDVLKTLITVRDAHGWD